MPIFQTILKRIRKINPFYKTNKAFLSLFKSYNSSKQLVLIDVGANKGLFTKEFSQTFDVKKAILIEPLPSLFDELKISFNNSKYTVYQVVLSNENNVELPFFINKFNETSSLLAFNNKSEELKDIDTFTSKKITVLSRTLDSIVEEHHFSIIDLLKIDVQGAELTVLKGAGESLSKVKYIWIETSLTQLYKGSAVFSDIYDFLKQSGFILLQIKEGYKNSMGELLQVDLFFRKK